jgi:hypothetical protein
MIEPPPQRVASSLGVGLVSRDRRPNCEPSSARWLLAGHQAPVGHHGPPDVLSWGEEPTYAAAGPPTEARICRYEVGALHGGEAVPVAGSHPHMVRWAVGTPFSGQRSGAGVRPDVPRRVDVGCDLGSTILIQ